MDICKRYKETMSTEYLHAGIDYVNNDIQELHKHILTATNTHLEQIPVFWVGIRRPTLLHNWWCRMSFLVMWSRSLLHVIRKQKSLAVNLPFLHLKDTASANTSVHYITLNKLIYVKSIRKHCINLMHYITLKPLHCIN